MTQQIPFLLPEFLTNPEQRCPCVLLVDTSSSMSGKPIHQINACLKLFKEEIMSDGMARQRIELALITFGGSVHLASDFQSPDFFTPPILTADGNTPMGEAVELGLEMLDKRKQVYKQAGIPYYRPWIFLISDGAPTDEWEYIAQKARAGDSDNNKKFCFFSVGVEGADLNILSKFSNPNRPPLRLKGLCFRELFMWLSASLIGISNSQVGEAVSLPSPSGWTVV